MQRETKLLLLCLVVILTASLSTLIINNQNPFEGKIKGTYKPGISAEADRAVNQAKKVFQEKQKLGEDFTDGPCLTNDLLPDWVADIAHKPRQKIDDLPQNQCQALLEGRATHFVEMDKNGIVIRVY